MSNSWISSLEHICGTEFSSYIDAPRRAITGAFLRKPEIKARALTMPD